MGVECGVREGLKEGFVGFEAVDGSNCERIKEFGRDFCLFKLYDHCRLQCRVVILANCLIFFFCLEKNIDQLIEFITTSLFLLFLMSF